MAQLIEFGIALIFLGFVLAFVAAILIFIRGLRSGGKTRGGGVLLIGPIPIIFGSDKQSLIVVVVLAIVLMLIALLFYSGLPLR